MCHCQRLLRLVQLNFTSFASDSCLTALLGWACGAAAGCLFPALPACSLLPSTFRLLPCGINKIIHGAFHVYFRLLGRHIADSCCSFSTRCGCIKNLRHLLDPDPVLDSKIAGKGQTSSFMCEICVARRNLSRRNPPSPPSQQSL